MERNDYDAENNVIRWVKDYQGSDERVVRNIYTADNRLASCCVDNASINDFSKPADFTTLPVQTVMVTTQKIYNGKGDCVGEQAANGTWQFYVRDNLGRLNYLVKQEDANTISLTEYRRNVFGDVIQKIQYAAAVTCDLGPQSPYITTGIPISAVVGLVSPNTALDRTTTYTRDHRGSLITFCKDNVFYFNPLTGQQGFAQPVTTYVNTIFGERRSIRRTRFPDRADLDYQFFNWMNRVGKVVATAEAIQVNSVSSVIFRITRTYYNTFLEENTITEFANGVAGVTEDMTLAQLDKSCMSDANRRGVERTYTLRGELAKENTSVGSSYVTIKLLTYTARSKIQTITYNDVGLGNVDEFRYYDPQDNYIACVDISRVVTPVSGADFNARPLTRYGYNAHGQKTYTLRYVNGTRDVVTVDQIPNPAGLDPTRDEQELDYYDQRGLLTIHSDAMNYSTISLYDRNRNLSRRYGLLSNPVIDGDPTPRYQIHIDEKRWVLDDQGRVIFSHSARDNVVSITTQTQFNVFGEEISAGPGDNTFPEQKRVDQTGRLWMDNSDRGAATIFLYDLMGTKTAEVLSATKPLLTLGIADLPTLVQDPTVEVTRFCLDPAGRVVSKIGLPVPLPPSGLAQLPSLAMTLHVNSDWAEPDFGSYSITWAKMPKTALEPVLQLTGTDGKRWEAIPETHNGLTGVNISKAWPELPTGDYQFTIVHSLCPPTSTSGYQYLGAGQPYGPQDVDQLLQSDAKKSRTHDYHPSVTLSQLSDQLIQRKKHRLMDRAIDKGKDQKDYCLMPVWLEADYPILLELQFNLLDDLVSVRYFDARQQKLNDAIIQALQHPHLYPEFKSSQIDVVPLTCSAAITEHGVCLVETARQRLRGNTLSLAKQKFTTQTIKTLRTAQEVQLIAQSELPPSEAQARCQSKSAAVTSETQAMFKTTGILHINTGRVAEKVEASTESLQLFLQTQEILRQKTQQIDVRAQWQFMDRDAELLLWGVPQNYHTGLVKIICVYQDVDQQEQEYQGLLPLQSSMDDSTLHYAVMTLPQAMASLTMLTVSLWMSDDPHEAQELVLYRDELPLSMTAQFVMFVDEERLRTQSLPRVLPQSDVLRDLVRVHTSHANDDWEVVDDPAEQKDDTLVWHFTPRTLLLLSDLPDISHLPPGTLPLLAYEDITLGLATHWKVLPTVAHQDQHVMIDVTGLTPGIYRYQLIASHDAPQIHPAENRVSYLTLRAGGEVFLSHPTDFNREITLSPAPVWQWDLDRWNNKTAETNPLGETTTFTYNFYNQKTCITYPPIDVMDERGNVTPGAITSRYYSYDALGRKTARMDHYANTPVWGFTWSLDNAGQVISLFLGDGGYNSTCAESNVYDLLGCKTNTFDSRGKPYNTSMTLDAKRNIIRLTKPSSTYTTYEYNERSLRRREVSDVALIPNSGQNGVTLYAYDENDNVIIRQDPMRDVQRLNNYDRHHQPTSILYPAPTPADPVVGDQQISSTYDYFGRMSQHILMNGITINYVFDLKSQITEEASSTQPPQNQAALIYDAEKTFAEGAWIRYGYQRLVNKPECGAASHKLYYFVNGYLTRINDMAINQVTDNAYDLLGRSVYCSIQFPWVAGTRVMQETYNARNWPIRIYDTLASVQNSYDPAGNLRAQRYSLKDIADGTTYSTYDGASRVLVDQGVLLGGIIQISAGIGTAYTYLTVGGLKTNYRYSETQIDPSIGSVVTSFAYNENGLLMGASRLCPSVDIHKVDITWQYFAPTNFLYLYQESHSDGSKSIKEAFYPPDGNEMVWRNNHQAWGPQGFYVQQETSIGEPHDRFGMWNTRVTQLALADSQGGYHYNYLHETNTSVYYDTPQIHVVKITPDTGDEKTATRIYDVNQKPFSQTSQNISGQGTEMVSYAVADSGAILASNHQPLSSNHLSASVNTVQEFAFIGPDNKFFASYTLCADPRDVTRNNLSMNYPDSIQGRGVTRMNALMSSRMLGFDITHPFSIFSHKETRGQPERFQLMDPVQPFMDYARDMTESDYQWFYDDSKNAKEAFKYTMAKPLSTFGQNSTGFFVVSGNPMSFADISLIRYGSTRYAAQIAATNGYPITKICLPGENIKLPNLQMNYHSYRDQVPFQDVVDLMLASLTPHVDWPKPRQHNTCLQTIVSVVIQVVAVALALESGGGSLVLEGVLAGAYDAAMQGIAVGVGVLSSFSWTSVIEAGFDAVSAGWAKGVIHAASVGAAGEKAVSLATLAKVAAIAGGMNIAAQLTELGAGLKKKFDFGSVITAIIAVYIDAKIPLPNAASFSGRIAAYLEQKLEGVFEAILSSAIDGVPFDLQGTMASMIGTDIGNRIDAVILPEPASTKSVTQQQDQSGMTTSLGTKSISQAASDPSYVQAGANGQGLSANDKIYSGSTRDTDHAAPDDSHQLKNSAKSDTNKPATSRNQNNPTTTSASQKVTVGTQGITGNSLTNAVTSSALPGNWQNVWDQASDPIGYMEQHPPLRPEQIAQTSSTPKLAVNQAKAPSLAMASSPQGIVNRLSYFLWQHQGAVWDKAILSVMSGFNGVMDSSAVTGFERALRVEADYVVALDPIAAVSEGYLGWVSGVNPITRDPMSRMQSGLEMAMGGLGVGGALARPVENLALSAISKSEAAISQANAILRNSIWGRGAKGSEETLHIIAKNRVQHEALKVELRQNMQKPIVQDHNLQEFIDELYRPNAKIGSGSTADAIREELTTGNPVGNRFHLQKGQDALRYLNKWIENNSTAPAGDRAAVENIIHDLNDALGLKPRPQPRPYNY